VRGRNAGSAAIARERRERKNEKRYGETERGRDGEKQIGGVEQKIAKITEKRLGLI
jgi:hypothetical protein